MYYEKARDRWVGAVTINGKRVKRTGKTETEARTKLNAVLRQRDLDEPVGDGNLTVGQLLDQWLKKDAAARDVAHATMLNYEWAVARLTEGLGAIRVRSLSVQDVEDVFEAWVNELGRSSFVKLRSVLSQALRFASRRNMATRNIAPDVIIPARAAKPKEKRSYTPEEALRLFEALDSERLGTLFLIAATVGTRPGEVVGLRWSNVSLDARTITLASARQRTTSGPAVVDQLKTTGSYRTVKLPARVIQALRAHRITQLEERERAERWDDPDLVFTTQVGTLIDDANLRRQLRRITEAAGLPSLTPNELRHTAASILSDDGTPLEEIADLLGHSSTRMLEQTYRHRVRPSVDAAVNTFDKLLGADDG